MVLGSFDNAHTDVNANRPDLPALGKLGALLLRTHYAFDQRRSWREVTTAKMGRVVPRRHSYTTRDVAMFIASSEAR